MNKRELQIEITKIMDRVVRDRKLSEFEKASLKNEIADLRSKMRAVLDIITTNEVEKISEENEEKPVKKKAKAKK